MLRDGWNFHNDVAMVIENKSRSCFGLKCPQKVRQ